MTTLINDNFLCVIAIIVTVAVTLKLQNISIVGKYMGPCMTVILLGIALSNTHIMPYFTDSYMTIIEYVVPISTAILLLNVDLKAIVTLNKRALFSMGIALVSICVVTLLVSLGFSSSLDGNWQLAGMFIGTYTGGSSNLTAISVALEASPELIAMANAADYVIGIPLTIVLFIVPRNLANSKKFNKLWPYTIKDRPELMMEASDDMFGSKDLNMESIATFLAVGTVIMAVATKLASFTPDHASALTIIYITTMSLILAQTKYMKKLKGNLDVGLYLGLTFLCVIGLTVDLSGFATNAGMVVIYSALIIFGTLTLHLFLSRLFKIEYEYALASVSAAIGDGVTASMIVSNAGWKNIAGVALVLGVLGGACGNYLGVGVGYLCRILMGG